MQWNVREIMRFLEDKLLVDKHVPTWLLVSEVKVAYWVDATCEWHSGWRFRSVGTFKDSGR